PSLKFHGRVQPMLFGFPVGNPADAVDFAFSKTGISFGMTLDLMEGFFKPLVAEISAGLAVPLVSLLSLGLDFRLAAHFSLKLPDSLATFLVEGRCPEPGLVLSDYLKSIF